VTPIFIHRLEVRFRDCDPMGHVNNAVYLTYLEQARFSHWRATGLTLTNGERGVSRPSGLPAPEDIPGVILARVEIDYRRPAKYGDWLDVRLGIASFGRSSFTYEYEIRDTDGALIAEARTVLVRFDYVAGRAVPLTEDLKQLLTRNLL
jgi:acyl-CoA thioester hydrolase